jgi:hypothetical protein
VIINSLEGEIVEIPVLYDNGLTEHHFSCVRSTSNRKTVENCFTKARFIKEDGFSYGTVKLENLEAGHYKIRIKESNQIIPLRIHRGVYWKTDSIIHKEHSLTEQRKNLNFIRIKNVKIKKEADSPNSSHST